MRLLMAERLRLLLGLFGLLGLILGSLCGLPLRLAGGMLDLFLCARRHLRRVVRCWLLRSRPGYLRPRFVCARSRRHGDDLDHRFEHVLAGRNDGYGDIWRRGFGRRLITRAGSTAGEQQGRPQASLRNTRFSLHGHLLLTRPPARQPTAQ